MTYYLGIDGGGSKTEFLLCNGTGKICAQIVLGGCSHLELGIQGVRQLAKNGLQQLKEQVGSGEDFAISAVGWGLPYYGEYPQQDMELQSAATGLFPDAVVYLCNDVEVGMAGSLALQPGVHIVAGTGAIAMAMDQHGNTARCGGWHQDFSDEGSAYWLGLQALNLFTRQTDGRIPKGPLYHHLKEALNLAQDIDLNHYYISHLEGNRKETARIQLILEQAALDGDEGAIHLYRNAAGELFQLADGAVRNLGIDWRGLRVSYFGGVFRAGSLILSPLLELMESKRAFLAEPVLSPAAGAVLLAVRATAFHCLRDFTSTLVGETRHKS